MKGSGEWLILSVVWLVVGCLAYVALDMTGSAWGMCVMVIPFLVTLNTQNRRRP